MASNRFEPWYRAGSGYPSREIARIQRPMAKALRLLTVTARLQGRPLPYAPDISDLDKLARLLRAYEPDKLIVNEGYLYQRLPVVLGLPHAQSQ